MPSTVFAPVVPNSASARAWTNPSTGNIYTANGEGSFVSADVDTPYFQAQGFVVQPSAALYMPKSSSGMARQITNPNTGNLYVFNSAGFATGITGADLTYFKNNGFVQVPAGTVLVRPPGPAQGMIGVLVNPANGNSYTVNGRGFVVAQAADLSWFYAMGFSPVATGTLLVADEEEPPPKAAKKK